MFLYFKVFSSFMRNSLLVNYEYRANFLLKILVYTSWTTVQLLFLSIIFLKIKEINGWSKYEIFLLLGIDQIIYSIFFGVVLTSLNKLENHVLTGSMDYIMLKPLNSQFIISFRHIDIFQIFPGIYGIGIFLYAKSKLNLYIPPYKLLLCIYLMIVGIIILYSLYIISVSFTFKYIKSNSLNNIIITFNECMAYPIDIYKGIFKFIITVIIPVGIVVDTPARMLVKHITLENILLSTCIGIVFFLLGIISWKNGIKHYTSASS
jgi:ABC-2 type transport system permease protein